MATATMAPRKNRLRELREAVRLTQKEVAKLLDIDHTTVNKHEAGTRGLTSGEIEKYAQVFKCQSHELFFAAEPEASAKK